PVEGLDVGLRERLVEVLVAQPPGRVAVAHLLLAEDGEGDVGLAENANQGPADLLLPVVVAARAAHEEEVLVLAGAVPHRKRQVLGPLVAPVLSHAPGVSLTLHALEDALDLRGKARLDLHLVTAHVDEPRNVLDEHWAGALAPATRRAGPDGLRLERAADDR